MTIWVKKLISILFASIVLAGCVNEAYYEEGYKECVAVYYESGMKIKSVKEHIKNKSPLFKEYVYTRLYKIERDDRRKKDIARELSKLWW